MSSPKSEGAKIMVFGGICGPIGHAVATLATGAEPALMNIDVTLRTLGWSSGELISNMAFAAVHHGMGTLQRI